MDKLKQYFDEILEELSLFETPMEKLQFVLEHGKDLTNFPENEVIEENKVPGCTSNVYIYMEKNSEGKVSFKATSEALIIGGYIAILFEGLNGLTKEEILNSEDLIKEFTLKAGIRESLTPTRANAFTNILNMIFDRVRTIS